ncbi:MAG: tetraacyldisaccharide 4'-kinase [Burkholderiales bacterium]|nr:tetraacyldisaccharide 4'-kinase [Burkholderiales bacterium]
MKLQTIIERHWYAKLDPFLLIILFPFSILYELVISIRKLLFTLRILPSTKIKVPVVIIGNISVGGAGKTPLTKHIAEELTARGVEFGIVLRGYKSKNKGITIVTPEHTSDEVGDEALIYASSGYKVAIGSKRVNAARALLKQHPNIKIILADDGMQHYALRRNMEICVVDSSRMFGNQQLLPVGPLRESMNRLNKVSAIVINGDYNQVKLNEILNKYKTHIFHQELQFKCFYNPVTNEKLTASEMAKRHIYAMAAIGNPGRFYDYLEKLGQKIKGVKTFPDHYHYQEHDIVSNLDIITTEKDYTKLAKFKPKNVWITEVSAKLNSDELINKIINLV